MHSEGFELTKLTYTRLENNLIRHRGDRPPFIDRCLVPGVLFVRPQLLILLIQGTAVDALEICPRVSEGVVLE